MRIRLNIDSGINRIRLCDPTGGYATAGLVMGATAIAGGYAAYGQRRAAKSQKAYNDYEASLLDTQAVLERRTAERNKSIITANAAEESKILGQQTAKLKGKQTASAAASGLGGGSVTTADIAADTITTEALDQAAIRYNADMQSWSVEEDAKNNEWALKNKANLYRKAGKNAVTAGNIAAMGTLLNTATSVASASYYPRYK
jgi:hypothetical protein